MYTREEQLDIFARIGVTKEAYNLLRKEKRTHKLSMTKLISNLILEKYGNNETPSIQEGQ